MMRREQVDGMLAEWDWRFNARQTRRVRTRSITGLNARSGASVREHLQRIVRRTPQVMVKISGGGRGMGRIRAHLDYISRNGKLSLEDQDGERHLGREDLSWLGYSWQSGGVPITEVSTRREALNIVLSMPAGTDAQALKRAARDFAVTEFAGHQYVMALHTPESDPSHSASAQPHVHLCVKMAGDDGRRLNPRKQDLQRWREGFAQRLREQGIDAAASRRLERFQSRRAQTQSLRHMHARGDALAVLSNPAHADQVERARQWEQLMLDRYGAVATMLARSDQREDRDLARDLENLRERSRAVDRAREKSR